MGNQSSKQRQQKDGESSKKKLTNKKIALSAISRFLPKNKKEPRPPSSHSQHHRPDTPADAAAPIAITTEVEVAPPPPAPQPVQRNTILQPLSRRRQTSPRSTPVRTPRISNASTSATSAISSANASAFSGLFSQIDVTSSIATESSFSRQSMLDDEDKVASPPPYTSVNAHRRSYLQVVRPHSSLMESSVILDSSVMLSSSISASTTFSTEALQDSIVYSSQTSASEIEDQDITIESSHQPITRHRLYSLLQIAQAKVKAQEQHAQSSSSASSSDNVTQGPSAILQEAFEQAQIVNDPHDYAEVYSAVSTFAQDTDNPSALVWVAQCHLNGWGVPRNAVLGFQQLSDLASKDLSEAYYPLATCYADGIGVTMDKTKAFQWFEKASIAGNTLAQYRTGAMLAQGVGVVQDDMKAFDWFKKSADAGNK
jgi:TPR repeat protein